MKTLMKAITKNNNKVTYPNGKGHLSQSLRIDNNQKESNNNIQDSSNRLFGIRWVHDWGAHGNGVMAEHYWEVGLDLGQGYALFFC